MRLNKMIAQSSDLSRRAADEAIARGEVSVNGRVVTEVGTIVDPQRDRVKLKGRSLRIDTRRLYIAFHKPRGYLVTKSDPKGRPTIWDILKKYRRRMNAHPYRNKYLGCFRGIQRNGPRAREVLAFGEASGAPHAMANMRRDAEWRRYG